MKRKYETLVIKKGGRLVKTKWSIKSQKWIEKNITREAIFHLFDHCEVESDVTLRDVFLLINRDLNFYKIFIRNWVEEIVEEGLNSKFKREDTKSERIDYLELYWHYEVDKFNKEKTSQLCMPTFPGFHGVGVSENKPTNWAIEMGPLSRIIGLPLKLKDKLLIFDYDKFKIGKKKYNDKYKGEIYKSPSYSLGQILYGIIWELSFFGSPKDRDAKSAELDKQIEEIKEDEKNVKAGKPSKFKTYKSVEAMMKDLKK